MNVLKDVLGINLKHLKCNFASLRRVIKQERKKAGDGREAVHAYQLYFDSYQSILGRINDLGYESVYRKVQKEYDKKFLECKQELIALGWMTE